ncbi:MAG: type III secretion system chaperone [Thermodesulforhabdaceae bacterium]
MERLESSFVIEEFIRGIGLTKTLKDSHGSESFIVDDMLVVIQDNPEEKCIECFSFIGEIPASSEKLLETLLEANFLFRQTGGATIGLSKATRVATLFYRIPTTDLTTSRFFEQMEHFINVSYHWKLRIEEMSGEIPSETSLSYDNTLRV